MLLRSVSQTLLFSFLRPQRGKVCDNMEVGGGGESQKERWNNKERREEGGGYRGRSEEEKKVHRYLG